MQAIAQFAILFAGPIGLVLLAGLVVVLWLWRSWRPEPAPHGARPPLELVPDARPAPRHDRRDEG